MKPKTKTIDLSRGPWISHQIAAEIYQQLDQNDWERFLFSHISRKKPEISAHFYSMASYGIDAEGAGSEVYSMGKWFIRQAKEKPIHLNIILPEKEFAGSENLLLIDFLESHGRPSITVDVSRGNASSSGMTYQSFSNPYNITDREEQTKRAWKEFVSGGRDLAINLLENVRQRESNELQLAIIDMQLQGMRIADFRFEEAAKVEVPSNTPRPIRRFLLISKGWSQTFSGGYKEAEYCFSEALQLQDETSHPLDMLYLKNIHALAKFRNGKYDEALRDELDIHKSLKDLKRPEYPLEYVNAINTARLYSYGKQFNEAASFYSKAFDTCQDSYTDSDLVYQSVCRARICEKMQDLSNARKHWLRAAIYWLSMEMRENISRRAANSILGSSATPQKFVGTNDIAQKLYEILKSYRNDASRREAKCEFIDRSSIQNPSCQESYFWNPVLPFSHTIEGKRLFYYPEHEKLEKLVSSFLGAHQGRIVIDKSFDQKSLRTKESWSIYRRIRLNGYEAGDVFVISEAIDISRTCLDQKSVYFKRYKDPLTISPTESKVLSLLSKGAQTYGRIFDMTDHNRTTIEQMINHKLIKIKGASK